MRKVAILLVSLAAAGCAGTTPPPRVAQARPPVRTAAVSPGAVPTHRRHIPHTAVPLSVPGVEDVVGARAGALVQRFGQPRLDLREGDARKLQFAGGACVLDVYLYPSAQGAEPQATYLDARLPDGRDTDRAGCVSALGRR